jgi:hypothetical protein
MPAKMSPALIGLLRLAVWRVSLQIACRPFRLICFVPPTASLHVPDERICSVRLARRRRISYQSRWITPDNTIYRDTASYNGAGADHTSIADRHSFQNHCPLADPHVVANFYGANVLGQWSLARSARPGIERMSVIVSDCDAGRDQTMPADSNGPCGPKIT